MQSMPKIEVPKFSIQLLVENAIKHGFIAKKELRIYLSYDTAQNRIILQNNGKAMKSTKFGTGLNNLAQRLNLLCKGKIEITDKETPTFTIYLGDCHENTHR